LSKFLSSLPFSLLFSQNERKTENYRLPFSFILISERKFGDKIEILISSPFPALFFLSIFFLQKRNEKEKEEKKENLRKGSGKMQFVLWEVIFL
jgi:hypothetical protein